MSIDFEKCNEFLYKFVPKVRECKGHSMIVPKRATSQDIDDWFESVNKLTDWKQDLLCAWGGHKIALVDYDYWPDLSNQKEIEEIVIRYLMVGKCGIQALYASDGDGAIYYDKRYWKEALLLHMYHEDLLTLPDIPRRRDVFQAILLGYTKDSIYEYTKDVVDVLEDFLLSNHGLDRSILTDLNVRQVKDMLQKLWNKSIHELKRYIYEQIYAEVYAKEKYQIFNEHFKEMQDFISTALKVIEENES